MVLESGDPRRVDSLACSMLSKTAFPAGRVIQGGVRPVLASSGRLGGVR